MKKLTVKAWHLFDIDFEKFMPELPHNFCRWIHLDIGYEEEQASSMFSIGVCSFTWLAHQYSNEGPRWGRHLLVVGQYNYEEIKKAIEERVQSCLRETWEESLKILCRDFAWEFEDYKP
jgi:hypothetical protein